MTDDGGTRLFDELVRRHGGADALGAVGLAIARSVAVLLTGDVTDRSAAAAAQLVAMLPPAKPPETADLSKLSNREFDVLATLLAKARGETIQPLPKRPRSLRTRDVLRLRNLLDRIQARIVAEDRYLAEPTEVECAELRNHISILLSRLNTTVDHALGISPAAMPAPARALQLLSPPIEAMAIELPANVIPMPQR